MQNRKQVDTGERKGEVRCLRQETEEDECVKVGSCIKIAKIV